MRSLAFGLLAIVCTILMGLACMAAAEIHGGFAVIAAALFAGAVASIVLTVDT